jgi:hypothetical protein
MMPCEIVKAAPSLLESIIRRYAIQFSASRRQNFQTTAVFGKRSLAVYASLRRVQKEEEDNAMNIIGPGPVPGAIAAFVG